MAFYDTKYSQYGMASATDQMIKAQQRLGEAQAKNAALASQAAAGIIEKLGALGAKAYGDYAEDKKQKASRAGLAKALNLNEEQTKAFVDGGYESLSAIAASNQVKAVNNGYVEHNPYTGENVEHITKSSETKNPSKYGLMINDGLRKSMQDLGVTQDYISKGWLISTEKGDLYYNPNLTQKEIDDEIRILADRVGKMKKNIASEVSGKSKAQTLAPFRNYQQSTPYNPKKGIGATILKTAAQKEEEIPSWLLRNH